MQVTTAGFLVADIIAANLPKIANPGEVVPAKIEVHVGGHPANVAIGLRKLGLPKKQVSVVGAVGEDIFGDFIVRELSKHDIVLHIERVPYRTNSNVILVKKGEDRRFHADFYETASWYLSPDHVIKVLEKEKPKIFYVAAGVEGELDRRLPEVLQRAKKIGCITFLAIIEPQGKGWDFVLPALEYVDLFQCNDLELRKITGKKLREGIKFISSKAATCFVTLGKDGVICAKERLTLLQPPFRVKSIDPTGAGDAFCAGVIFELLRCNVSLGTLDPDSLSRLALFGQAVGAVCTTAVGTTSAINRRNVDKLISAQGDHILKNTKVIR